MSGLDDSVAGMTGLLGATMLAGVGTAAGLATIRMIEKMGDYGTGSQPPRKRRRRG